MTDSSTEDVNSGVVDMESVRIVSVVAQLNGLLIVASDAGNTFFYGITKECVYIIAGPEFGSELCGKIPIIYKALYKFVVTTGTVGTLLNQSLCSLVTGLFSQ